MEGVCATYFSGEGCFGDRRLDGRLATMVNRMARRPEARQVVEDYVCRWMIEEYHKALKADRGIEEMQPTTLHGPSNAIALPSVPAVRVPRLRRHARDEAIRGQPARLHEDPLKVRLTAKRGGHAHRRSMTVWEFYVAVARMGGYMLNPAKRPPGWIVP